jgi:hypothetical protein
MAIPHKEAFTYCYLGGTNSVGWWGYDWSLKIDKAGFINTAGNSTIQPFNPVGEWAWQYYHAFPNYPLTTPSNIVVMQDLEYPGSIVDALLYYGGELYLKMNGFNSSFTYPINAVESMYEPLHPNGEPYTNNDESPSYDNPRLYPRWVGESPYDWWNATVPSPSWPYYSQFNPQVLTTFTVFNSIGWGSGFSIKKTEAYNGLSRILNLTTSEYESVAFNPENSSLQVNAKFALMFKSRLCCFNKGARIAGKVVLKKVSMIVNSAGDGENYGYVGFNITFGGEPVEHSLVDFEFTIGPENANETPVKIKDIDIPAEDGYAVFIDDFYITTVTKP